MSSPNQAPAGGFDSEQQVPQSDKERVVRLLNLTYIRTLPFILRIILIVLEVCGAISVSVQFEFWSETRYYNFVAVTGILIALLSIVFNLCQITDKFQNVPWSFMEMCYDALWALLMLIASIIVTYNAKQFNLNGYAAAAFFGFASMVVYLVDGFLRLVPFIRNGGRIRAPAHEQSAASRTQPPY